MRAVPQFKQVLTNRLTREETIAMSAECLLTAKISAETHELVERFLAANEVTQSQLVESALLHHLHALDTLPGEFVIPPAIHLSRQVGDHILDRLANPSPPSDAMRELFDD